MNSQPANRKFITKAHLAERWDCNPVTIQRKVERDPDMPRPYKFSRFETYSIDEIEAYERKKAMER